MISTGFSTLSVLSPRRFARLSANDLRNILRDPTLLAVLIFSILPAILFYFFEDWMNITASSTFGLSDISRFAAPVFFLVPAYLIGWVIGFLILEERDEGTLPALNVTPVGKSGIALYRAVFTFCLVFSISLASAPILFQNAPVLSWLMLTLFAALQAVMVTFALPAIANNKVQGLAMTKVMNLFTMVPLLAILSSPWRYLAAFLPSFWVGEYLALSSSVMLPIPAIIVLGLGVHLAVIFGFYRRLLSRQ